MKKSKKGVTLVELVICCGILVILAGACTAVLMSGEKVFSTSANSANTQIEANVLQNFLFGQLPSVKTVTTVSVDDAKAATEGTYLYFDDDVFTINAEGSQTTIDSVQEFKCSFLKAGESASVSARAQFTYTVTMKDGSTFSGGMVLSNMKYDDSIMSVDNGDGTHTPIEYSIKDVPAAFDAPSGS